MAHSILAQNTKVPRKPVPHISRKHIALLILLSLRRHVAWSKYRPQMAQNLAIKTRSPMANVRPTSPVAYIVHDVPCIADSPFLVSFLDAYNVWITRSSHLKLYTGPSAPQSKISDGQQIWELWTRSYRKEARYQLSARALSTNRICLDRIPISLIILSRVKYGQKLLAY